eukprot:3779629-Pyramimonas_sp.AAC.1
MRGRPWSAEGGAHLLGPRHSDCSAAASRRGHEAGGASSCARNAYVEKAYAEYATVWASIPPPERPQSRA